MKSKHWPINRLLLMIALLAACQPTPAPPSTIAPSPTPPANANPLYKDAGRPAAERAQDLLSRMTLAEKIGQMTQVEKDSGFIVSDWGAIDQIATDYRQAVIAAINAGVDMNMVPQQYDRFIATLTQAVEAGDVPLARIDDAVRRILTVKFALGLFENPLPPNPDMSVIGSEAHRALGREAVRKSLVLLKNDNAALPLAKDTPLIFVAGQAANDIGTQCGGWTITWQGSDGAITPGVTLLDGIEATVSTGAQVQFNRFGKFDGVAGADGQPAIADVGIVALAEAPYAEGVGDRADLRLSEADAGLIARMRQQSRKKEKNNSYHSWQKTYGARRPRSRGKRVARRMLSRPSNCIRKRSRPMAKPPCGGMPYLNTSRYASKAVRSLTPCCASAAT